MTRFFRHSNIFLLCGFLLTSCLGSKFLVEDEQILAKQKIKGLSGSLKDDALLLTENQANTRFLGYPFTHLAHLYKLGENGISLGPRPARKKMRLADKKEIFDLKIAKATTPEKKDAINVKKEKYVTKKQAQITRSASQSQFTILRGYDRERAIAKRNQIEEKYNLLIAEESKPKKQKKLQEKKAKKMDKSTKKINQGNLIMKWGEPLYTYDHTKAKIAARSIQEYLYSKGYFHAHVAPDTSDYASLSPAKKQLRNLRNQISRISGAKHRYINLTFVVDKGPRHYIDSIQYDIEDKALKDLLLSKNKKSPLKRGYYDQSTLSKERDYLYDMAVNNGYFDFSKQYISFQIDSTLLSGDKLIIREIIQNPENRKHHKVFYLDSIVFISEAGVSRSVKRRTRQYQDITFSFGEKVYNEKILAYRIPMEQKSRYSKDLTIETQRQLSFLDNFKFVNINYDTLDSHFIANIFTSPFKRFETSSEAGLSSSGTDGSPGPFVNINLKNRNTFRSLEIMTIEANAKLQDLKPVQDFGEEDITDLYTSRQLGGKLSMTIPKFLFPIGKKYQNRLGKYNPTTLVSLGISFEDRITEYTRLQYRGTFSYWWQIRDRIRYDITPAQIRWIDSNNSETFEEFLSTLSANGNAYANAFKSAVVGSSSFGREQNFGNYGKGGAGAFLKTTFEIGGHFNMLLQNPLFGEKLEAFEYFKTNVDIRKITPLDRNYHLAYRLNVGYAYPFGANGALPFDRYFFAGGSGSIRGWKPRRLGPGSYAVFETQDQDGQARQVNFDVEQPGEILIESSVELRRDVASFLEGALFVDAGNIWRIENNSDDPEFDKAVFQFDRFYNEIAVAAGLGARFDLQFIILRLDLGFKMYDPAQEKGNRFVGDQIFTDFNYNSEFNIGIGYPF